MGLQLHMRARMNNKGQTDPNSEPDYELVFDLVVNTSECTGYGVE